jgi:succinate dehydrogenase / fumarate reductase flavoprotein subunit/L-aspartate oxidase
MAMDSGYPPQLRELVKVVEQTRPERLAKVRRNEHFEKLDAAGRETVLAGFHPDYKSGGRRKVKVGPNKGDVLPDEIADLMEARSRVEPGVLASLLKEPDYDTDVLVLGGGGAGSSAALFAMNQGAGVVLATKLRHGDSNTVMAEGGVQAADRPFDSPYYHWLDTMGGGHFTNDPRLVKVLALDAPLVIQWLESLGMMFDKDADGSMKELKGGGICRRRMHSAADMTGAEIMRVQRDEVRNHPDKITVLEFSPAVELLLDSSGRASGAVLYNLETEEYSVVRAKAVVMATGGSGRLHIQGFPTTNHYGACGDGLVIAYRAGVPVNHLRYSQYHPTGVAFPEQNIGLLITEKVRTLGGHVLNRLGEEFCFPLEPRDVESACIIRECDERGLGVATPAGRQGVWLDSPMIDILRGPGTTEHGLAAKFIQFKRYGIDISKQPILVYPTLHYQNGGLEIGEWGETRVPGLYAAGEVSGGIHGDNRLMGNSLLDINVFGRRCGLRAAEFALSRKVPASLSLDHVVDYHARLDEAGIKTRRVAPMLLPDYTSASVKARQLSQSYCGTMRTRSVAQELPVEAPEKAPRKAKAAAGRKKK